jgi:hypothetical protein
VNLANEPSAIFQLGERFADGASVHAESVCNG